MRRLARRDRRTPQWLRVLAATALAAAGLSGIVGGSQSSGAVPAGGPEPPDTSPAALTHRTARLSKSPIAPAAGELTTPAPSSPALIAEGRSLYALGCSSCHGIALQGRHGVAPSLIGVGAGPADFYLATGRMPLQSPKEQPLRAAPLYKPKQIEALVAFVASFGGPPRLPPTPRVATLRWVCTSSL